MIPLTQTPKSLLKSYAAGFEINPVNIDPDHFKVKVNSVEKKLSYENVPKLTDLIFAVFEQYLELYVSNSCKMLDATIFPLNDQMDFSQTLYIELDLLETNSPTIFIEAYVYDSSNKLVAKGSQKVSAPTLE